jgi:antitoxin (DNA-binding transcriptional repressor) of toxin-antitoxin stability system
MRMVGIEETTLDTLVRESQRERVVITRNGKPMALVVGVEGMDKEQLELGANAKFWELIAERRAERAISREELEHRIAIKESHG